jgi:hypothetical protein
VLLESAFLFSPSRFSSAADSFSIAFFLLLPSPAFCLCRQINHSLADYFSRLRVSSCKKLLRCTCLADSIIFIANFCGYSVLLWAPSQQIWLHVYRSESPVHFISSRKTSSFVFDLTSTEFLSLLTHLTTVFFLLSFLAPSLNSSRAQIAV